MSINEFNGGGNSNSLAKAAPNADVLKTLNWIKSRLQNSDSGTRIVDTYRSGSKWWRKYSDGFIEQGDSVLQSQGYRGQKTITLHTPFKSTSYTCLAISYTTAQGNNDIGMPISKTTSSFTVGLYVTTTGTYYHWYACGY